MANQLTIEDRILKAKWTAEDDTVDEQTFKNINTAATAEQMDNFFNAIAALTTDTLSFKGYEDTQDLTTEE